MQDSKIVVLETYGAARKSAVNRRPRTTDGRLAAAIHALHDEGPKLVCALWEEIDRLEAALADAKRATPRNEAAIDEARALVDKLRER